MVRVVQHFGVWVSFLLGGGYKACQVGSLQFSFSTQLFVVRPSPTVPCIQVPQHLTASVLR